MAANSHEQAAIAAANKMTGDYAAFQAALATFALAYDKVVIGARTVEIESKAAGWDRGPIPSALRELDAASMLSVEIDWTLAGTRGQIPERYLAKDLPKAIENLEAGFAAKMSFVPGGQHADTTRRL